MKLLIKKLDERAKLPTKTNDSDAGIDLYALEDTLIYPGETVKVRTGIAIQLEDTLEQFKHLNLVNLLWDRSGLGSKGIHRLAGVIDQEYTGEMVVCLTNLNIRAIFKDLADDCGSQYNVITSWSFYNALQVGKYEIKAGDKIIQTLVQTVIPVKIEQVEELKDTKRGSKGFGSSGK